MCSQTINWSARQSLPIDKRLIKVLRNGSVAWSAEWIQRMSHKLHVHSFDSAWELHVVPLSPLVAEEIIIKIPQ